MTDKDPQQSTYLARANGNFLAATMLYITESRLPAWAKTILRVLFMTAVVAAILGGLLWPILW